MIAIDLQCTNNHRFEGWFDSNTEFESQTRNGMIECPVCSCKGIFRVPSTFAIKKARNQEQSPTVKPQIDIHQFEKIVVEYVKKNFDDVGSNFAQEALKIHYGVSKPRNIRGVSTPKEEETLKEEGVSFIKVPAPVPPDDHSDDD